MRTIAVIFIFLAIMSFTFGQRIRKEVIENTKHYKKNVCSYQGVQIEPRDEIAFNYPRCGLYSCSATYTMTIKYCNKNENSIDVFPGCCSRRKK